MTMSPEEEITFWLSFGYTIEEMLYCEKCNVDHEIVNCQRNG
jgi:hypothetical protein